MADVTAKPIDEMEATFAGSMRRIRAELGLTSFGVQTVDLPPDIDRYPWHDHANDGQEEMFLAIAGGGWLEIEGGERYELGKFMPVRVGPGERRRVVSGPKGIRVLIIGGIPGRAYEEPDFSRLGEPDPMAAAS